MSEQSNNPYIKEYLYPLMELHRLVFIELEKQFPQKDIFSLIDTYMRESQIRERMDEGNWIALNKGYKQVINSIPMDHCEEFKGNVVDDIALRWMADIYVLLQWTYNIPSKRISECVPAKELFFIFSPLHEASEKIACEKIYKKYIEDSNKDMNL